MQELKAEKPIESPEGSDPVVTTLEGEVTDQAALAGILNTLYELHLPILSLKWLNIW